MRATRAQKRKENENKNLEYSNLFFFSFSQPPIFHSRKQWNAFGRKGDPTKQVLFDMYARESRAMCPTTLPPPPPPSSSPINSRLHPTYNPALPGQVSLSPSLRLTFAPNSGPRIERLWGGDVERSSKTGLAHKP